MSLPDAIRESIDAAVSEAPTGDKLLAATRRRTNARRTWLLPAAAAVVAVVAVAAGAVAWHPTRGSDAPVSPAAAANAELDGVRVTLRLDRSSVQLGDVVHATATVTNTRGTPVTFGGGSCQAPQFQPNVDVDLRAGIGGGRTWTGAAAALKQQALADAPYRSSFSRTGLDVACLDYYRTWQLAPGQTLTVRDLAWRARTPLNSAYDGVAGVRAVFRFMTDPAQQTPKEVAAALPLHVNGGDPSLVTPATAVDVALADPEFAAFVEAHPPTTGGAAVTSAASYFDAQQQSVRKDVWLVSLRANGSQAASVTIDAHTGTIVRRDLPATTALEPPDSQTPAAGTCGTTPGPIATIELNPDVPGPRCLIVRADQRLRVVNTTNRAGSPGEVVTLRWPPFAERQLAIGASTTYDRPMGDYLAPGVHRLNSTLYAGSGAEIWLKP